MLAPEGSTAAAIGHHIAGHFPSVYEEQPVSFFPGGASPGTELAQPNTATKKKGSERRTSKRGPPEAQGFCPRGAGKTSERRAEPSRPNTLGRSPPPSQPSVNSGNDFTRLGCYDRARRLCTTF